MIIVPDKGVVMVPYDEARRVKWLNHFARWKWVTYKGAKYLALPHDLTTAWKLAGDGIDIPGPIRYYYGWPGIHAPFAHQRVTADFLTKHSRCFVFNDIGTAKTMSALWAADYLHRQGVVGRVLIISPLSTLERVWADEIFRNFPGASAGVVYGSREKRQRIMQENHRFYIINPDALKMFCSFERVGKRSVVRMTEFMEEFIRGIDLVIVDESAVFRTRSTDRWQALNAIVKDESKRLWMMSGEPMPHSPVDIWAQARLVSKHLVPLYFTSFRDQVMTKVTDFKWVPKPGWEKIVGAMVRPAIRFRRDRCVDLPPVVYEKREAALTPAQHKLERDLMREYRAEHSLGQITVANEGVRRNKLAQVYAGAVYNDDGTTTYIKNERLGVLREALEEAGGKALVFTPYRHLINGLAKKFPDAGIIHSGVSVNQRNEIFRRFQEDTLDLIIAHPKTMAHGLTLTKTNVVIWWSPTEDYEIYSQANGRITRPGQTRKQVIIHIGGSKLEWRMYRRLREKESMQGLLLELVEEES